MKDAERIASIVNEWFQGEPTPERQQNMRRTSLINELVAVVTEARNDWYASNRVIHRLYAEMDALRAKVAEEIAAATTTAAGDHRDKARVADRPEQRQSHLGIAIGLDKASAIAHEHGKES